MARLEWSKDPESCAGGSVATCRTGRKKLTVQNPVLKPRKDGSTDDGHSRKRTNETRTATWNISTMYIPGRLQEIAEEVLKYKLDIVAVQEIRWQGTGKIDKPNYTFYYGGTKEKRGQYGTGFIVNETAKGKIIQFEVKNERISKIGIRGKYRNISTVNVYVPKKRRVRRRKRNCMMT